MSLLQKLPINQNQLPLLLTLTVIISSMALIGFISMTASLFSILYTMVVYCDKSLFRGYSVMRMVVFILLTALLLLHKVPGFNNIAIYQDIKFAENTLPYSLYINFDKLLIASVLLPYVLLKDKVSNISLPSAPFLGRYTQRTTLCIISLITLVVSFVLAWLLGLITWQLKLPEETLIFFTKMLVITVVAEECVFRGMLQRSLCDKIGLWGVILISGIFFGAVHVGFSPLFALVSVFAGLGYGLVYYYSRSIVYPIALHFTLNSIHAIFFSYPMLS